VTFILVNIFRDKLYSNDDSFFGNEPSRFAILCYEQFEKSNAKRILELGCGQGRDTLFFASNGLDVYALDSSKVAVDNLFKKARERNIPVTLEHFDARRGIPYGNKYFDAVYSHMFYNMNFTDEELGLLFIESRRLLQNNGLLYFSVRSDKDAQYNTGKKIDTNIYEINGFQIRFFTKAQIRSFLSDYFEIKNIIEDYEEPASLYLVLSHKKYDSK
jgi:SAM-dependent methyltransferase